MGRKPEADGDLSPEAVARRLQDLAELYDLATSLAGARILGPVRADPPRASRGGAPEHAGLDRRAAPSSRRRPPAPRASSKAVGKRRTPR